MMKVMRMITIRHWQLEVPKRARGCQVLIDNKTHLVQANHANLIPKHRDGSREKTTSKLVRSCAGTKEVHNGAV